MRLRSIITVCALSLASLASLAALASAAVGGVAAPPALAAAVDTVALEDLTSPELRARIAQGTRTVLIPIGGTEQNGSHMVLGKHNRRAALLAERIARALGDAVVAPVMAYVPEGSIDPPQAHMRWAGTLSIPDPAFEAVLEGAAASLRRHGFTTIVFLGDHGGYRAPLERVAARLDHAWCGSSGTRCRVLGLPEYYQAADSGFAALLRARGYTAAEIGLHAGLADTALSLALDPALVRSAAMLAGPSDGVRGDPRRATVELGQLGVELIVTQSAAAIRAQRDRR
ncbi:MAG: creatininase family protein [Rubrivivax sp.]